MTKVKHYRIIFIILIFVSLALLSLFLKDILKSPQISKSPRKVSPNSTNKQIAKINKLLNPAVTLEIANETKKKFDSLSNANAKYPLYVQTYNGANQPIHPKVVAFSSSWNGYKYWMAYTPYNGESDFDENPCITVSNNLVNWTKPKGLTNPLQRITYADSLLRYHYSDTHLLFNPVTKKLEIWYRFNRNNLIEQIYRQTSVNGVKWSKKELMLDFDKGDKKQFCYSPAILFENNLYKMWYVNSNLKLCYITSTNAISWSMPIIEDLKFDMPVPYSIWHLDVQKTDLGYEILASSFPTGNSEHRILFHSKSADGSVWDKAEPIIVPSGNKSGWDSKQIYRSCLLKLNKIYYVFYSAQGNNRKWNIGLTSGADIQHLVGYSIPPVPKIIVPKLAPIKKLS